jgi:hypothetical protein
MVLAPIDVGRQFHSADSKEFQPVNTMSINRVVSITACGVVLPSLAATPFVVPSSSSVAPAETEACSLLSTADASKALEATSVPGKRQMEQSATGCVWSNDPAARDSSRRLVLNTHSVTAFGMAKRGTVATIKIEPVSGIGDEAFYLLFPSGSPFIWVRKGNNAISLRILTWDKPRVFTNDQDKAKLAVLAKAAIAKL